VGAGVGVEEGVGMEAGEVAGVGGEVKREQLVGDGVPLMLATWIRFWLLPSHVAAASVLHSAAVGGSVVGDVGPL